MKSVRAPERLSEQQVMRTIGNIGEAANIVVNRDPLKFASAHDLRRSFGTRWARRVMPATLKELMRHSHINTTMEFYVQIGADEIAEEAWNAGSEIDLGVNLGASPSAQKETPHSDTGKHGVS